MAYAGSETAKDVPGQRQPEGELGPTRSGVLLEQAKGALMLHWSIDGDTALRVLEAWAGVVDVSLSSVVHALVREVCPPSSCAPGSLAAWLEDQLALDCPTVHGARAEHGYVAVAVDESFSSVDEVVTAARRAAALGVPLQLTFPEREHGAARAHLLQRVDLAFEVARAVEPGLLVRLPTARP